MNVQPAKHRDLSNATCVCHAVCPTPTLSHIIGEAISDTKICSRVAKWLNVTEYACAHDRYRAKNALSMSITPAEVVVKSYLVASVALGNTFAVLAAVVQFSVIILGIDRKSVV